MAMFWCLVDIRHLNGGNQDEGLVCTRRYFKKWFEGGSDHAATEALAVLVQLGLVDVVDPGMPAQNPRFSRPRRYALTIEPFGNKPRTDRWQTKECEDRATALLAEKRKAAVARAARFRPAGGRCGGRITSGGPKAAANECSGDASPSANQTMARRRRTARDRLQ
jgi:hypothetical protein